MDSSNCIFWGRENIYDGPVQKIASFSLHAKQLNSKAIYLRAQLGKNLSNITIQYPLRCGEVFNVDMMIIVKQKRGLHFGPIIYRWPFLQKLMIMNAGTFHPMTWSIDHCRCLIKKVICLFTFVQPTQPPSALSNLQPSRGSILSNSFAQCVPLISSIINAPVFRKAMNVRSIDHRRSLICKPRFVNHITLLIGPGFLWTTENPLVGPIQQLYELLTIKSKPLPNHRRNIHVPLFVGTKFRWKLCSNRKKSPTSAPEKIMSIILHFRMIYIVSCAFHLFFS